MFGADLVGVKVLCCSRRGSHVMMIADGSLGMIRKL